MTDKKKNDDLTTDTNAGDDALQGTIADAEVKHDLEDHAPQRNHPEDDAKKKDKS